MLNLFNIAEIVEKGEKKMKIGILCPSEIAFRRFLPALQKCEDYQYIGVAVADVEEWFGRTPEEVGKDKYEPVLAKEREKAETFEKQYGGKIFSSYRELIQSDETEAVYIPLPPALHYKWAKLALECGKHVLVEKPSTTDAGHTAELVEIAKKNGLALHENYMFAFHDQLKAINNIVEQGILGDVRLYRINFGFPRRAKNDFRYVKALGGGALLDCGGYTLKYASMLLGSTARIAYSHLNYTDEFDVDLYGSAAMINDQGVTVQISFGMDNSYKCELEIWGSEGCLTTGRILTAPAGFVPNYKIVKGQEVITENLPADDTFYKSLQHFKKCIENQETRIDTYQTIQRQADLVEEFIKKAV